VSECLSRRFDVRLNLSATDDQVSEAIRCAGIVFKAIQTLDKHVKLLVWDEEKFPDGAALSSLSTLKSYSAFIKYFHPRGRPKATGGFTYWSLCLELHSPIEELLKNIEWSLSAAKHGLWLREIQACDTIVLGWLLYSTRDMSKVKVANALKDLCHCEIGVRWRAIYSGPRKVVPAGGPGSQPV